MVTSEPDLPETATGELKIIQELTSELTYLKADFINYKRRSQTTLAAAEDAANIKTLKKLIPTLDNLDAGSHLEKTANQNLTEAVLRKAVTDLGLHSFGLPGDLFDPKLHEAIAIIFDENAATSTIKDIQLPGYLYKSQVIRHAKVTVYTNTEL